MMYLCSYGCVPFNDQLTAINFDASGSKVCIGLSDGVVHCLQLGTDRWLYCCRDYSKSVTAVCPLPDGHVAGYIDGSLLIWVSGLARMLTKNHNLKISSIVPADGFFVAGSCDMSVSVWRYDGSFVYRVVVDAEVTVLVAGDGGKVVYIGCCNGKVYRLDVATSGLTALSIPAKVAVSCLAVSGGVLGVGSGNIVILCDHMGTGQNIIQMPCEVCALGIRDSNSTVTVVCNDGFVRIFDRSSGSEMYRYLYADDTHRESRILTVMCDDKVFYVIDNVARICTIPQDPKLELFLMADMGLDSSSRVFVMDDFGFIVGQAEVPAGINSLKLMLNLRAGDAGRRHSIALQKGDGTSLLYSLRYSLMAIKKIILARPLGRDGIRVLYGVVPEDTLGDGVRREMVWHHARPILVSCILEPSFSPVVSAILYSMNVALKSAFLKKLNGSIVPGVNIVEAGAVWKFQDESQGCRGCCDLMVKTGRALYSWKIHHLNEQSEFFLSVESRSSPQGASREVPEFPGAHLRLRHYIEHVNQVDNVQLDSIMPLPV
jgi:WD40 repeat protein